MIDQDIIDITSGNLTAKLHKERFICPGINRECIEFDGMFITPKTFYHLADKSSLKDWKNAIRINGKKIRWYIESGSLDFYNHSELCTGRCKGRTPGIKHSTPIPVALTRSPVVSDVSKIKEETYTSLPDHSEEKWKRDIEATAGFKIFDSISEEQRDIKPTKEQLNHMMLLNLVPGRNGENDTLPAADGQEVAGSHGDETENMDDDKMFWKAIVELGLVDEFFREIKSKLDVLKHNLIKNYVPLEDAKSASVIINELGMRDKLDLRLCAHKQAFDRQRYRLDKEMEALKKKVHEYEYQQDILKRKSDCFEQLINKKPKLEDSSSSRRKSGIVMKFQSNSIESFYAPSPTNSRTSMCSPGPSASQESLTNSRASVCSPGPSASPESLIEHSQSVSHESLIDQSQSSNES